MPGLYVSGALNAECASRPLCIAMPMAICPEGGALNEECMGAVGGRGFQLAHEYSARTGNRRTLAHSREVVLETFIKTNILKY